MSAENKYVQPPTAAKNRIKNTAEKFKSGYDYLAPGYWKRKAIHLFLVLPVNFFIYSYFLTAGVDRINISASSVVGGIYGLVSFLIVCSLTLCSGYYYPFSLYWYNNSFMGRLLNNMWFFGGILAIIGRVLAVVIGGILISGLFSPIAGPIILWKCRRQNRIIGEDRDFV